MSSLRPPIVPSWKPWIREKVETWAMPAWNFGRSTYLIPNTSFSVTRHLSVTGTGECSLLKHVLSAPGELVPDLVEKVREWPLTWVEGTRDSLSRRAWALWVDGPRLEPWSCHWLTPSLRVSCLTQPQVPCLRKFQQSLWGLLLEGLHDIKHQELRKKKKSSEERLAHEVFFSKKGSYYVLLLISTFLSWFSVTLWTRAASNESFKQVSLTQESRK